MMQKMLMRVSGLVLLLGMLGVATASEVSFSEKVKVTTDGAGAKITFAVSAPTDVEITVLDKDNSIVRHLAAGVLDDVRVPPEPLKKGLAQELLWDGKTDAGKVATGSPFAVRVRLGLSVKLDKFIAEQKHHIAHGFGLATDQQGHIYIYSASTGNKAAGGTPYMLKYTREGEYVKTVMPLPADLDPARASSLGMVNVAGDESLFPKGLAGTWPIMGFKPGSLWQRTDADGNLTFFDWKHLYRLANDGGPVATNFSMSVWDKQPSYGQWRYKLNHTPYVAMDPTGKIVYMTGLSDKKGDAGNPAGRIYKLVIADGKRVKFADVEGGKTLTGMDFDGDGNLLVCASDKVVAINPAGKQVGEFACQTPSMIACDRKSGAIYVMSTGKKRGNWHRSKVLIKFNNWKEGKEISRLDFGDKGADVFMAIDDQATKPLIWVLINRTGGASPYNLKDHAKLLRLEDQGDAFVETAHNIDYFRKPFGTITRLAVHPITDQVLCRGEYSLAAAYDGGTGNAVTVPFKNCLDMGVGLDGNWYIVPGDAWMGTICKYDSNFKPILTPAGAAGGKNVPKNKAGFEFGRYGAGFGVAGITADADGKIYALQQCNAMTVAGDMLITFDPSGKPGEYERMKDSPLTAKHHKHFNGCLFGPISTVVGGVAVDWKGFVYLALRTLPMKHKPPLGYEKDAGYWHCTGSIVKIGPSGGSLFDLGGKGSRPPKKVREIPADMKGIKVENRNRYGCGPQFCEGALKIYPGIGVMGGSYGGGCRCRQPMFELDGWGRLFIPNATTYSVQVVDNEGNEILKFGHYGNADSRGDSADSLVSTPAIPLGWPEAVGVSDKAVYVADVLNRRVVRLKKVYAAESVSVLNDE